MVRGLWSTIKFHIQSHLSFPGLRLHEPNSLADQGADVGGFELELFAALVDAGEIKNVFDQSREPPAFLAHQTEILGLFVRGADPAQFEALGQKPDRGNGRAQFVGHARDELALHFSEEFLAMERAPGRNETDQRGGRGHGDQSGEPIGAGALTREQQGRIIQEDRKLEHAEHRVGGGLHGQLGGSVRGGRTIGRWSGCMSAWEITHASQDHLVGLPLTREAIVSKPELSRCHCDSGAEVRGNVGGVAPIGLDFPSHNPLGDADNPTIGCRGFGQREPVDCLRGNPEGTGTRRFGRPGNTAGRIGILWAGEQPGARDRLRGLELGARVKVKPTGLLLLDPKRQPVPQLRQLQFLPEPGDGPEQWLRRPSRILDRVGTNRSQQVEPREPVPGGVVGELNKLERGDRLSWQTALEQDLRCR